MTKPVIASYEATASVKVLEVEDCKAGSSSTSTTEASADGNEAAEDLCGFIKQWTRWWQNWITNICGKMMGSLAMYPIPGKPK